MGRALENLHYEDIVSAIEPEPGDVPEIDPSWLYVIKYQLNVEQHTPSYGLYSRLNSRFLENPDRSRGLNIWEAHEDGHARRLHRAVQFFDPDFPGFVQNRQQEFRAQSKRARIAGTIMPLLLSVHPDLADAATSVQGLRNELMTGYSYQIVQDGADHPYLDSVLPPIRRQEPQHAGVYKEQAEELLDGSRSLQTQTRALLSRLDSIVGEPYRPKHEANTVIRKLFAQPRTSDIVERVDTQVSSLAGMHDLRLLRDRVDAAFS